MTPGGLATGLPAPPQKSPPSTEQGLQPHKGLWREAVSDQFLSP